jgi:CheY-like chemotaxis protein
MPKVLLAEDDYTMISLLKTLLGMEGYQVSTLLEKTGDVIKNVRREMPDVILLDVHLGSQNGVELLRKIRQAADLKSIKVIMTSGMDMQDQCLAAGADDFLLKPYMPDDLTRKLRTLIKQASSS